MHNTYCILILCAQNKVTVRNPQSYSRSFCLLPSQVWVPGTRWGPCLSNRRAENWQTKLIGSHIVLPTVLSSRLVSVDMTG